jgi:hypothetical protein
VTVSRAPRVNDIRIAGERLQASLGEVVTEITLSYGVDAVAELSITAIDPNGRLERGQLAALGTEVRLARNGNRWRVGTVETAYGAGALWTFRCRSVVAQELRRTFKSNSEAKVSPTEWVTRKVKEAGGTTVAQKSNKRLAIGQSGGDDRQSVLDVISSLAGELEWRWAEVDGVMYFGHPHWAWQGGAGTPAWRVTWKDDPRTDALELSSSLSDDDLELAGQMDLSLSYAQGSRLRPWHRLEVRNAGTYDGTWLVDSVEIPEDGVSPVRVTAQVPRKPSKKKGSDE